MKLIPRLFAPDAAPSAAPAIAAPAIPAAPAAAPSAASPTPPKSLADYQELALKSLRGDPAPGAATPPAQEPPAVEEPAPASPEPAPGAEPAVEPPVADPEPVAPAADDDEPEVPAAEQERWSEGEKKLYGALMKERTKRKEARNELKETKEQLAQLTAKVAELGKEPETPAAAPSAPPSNQPLGNLNTFDEIDNAVAQAAETETLVFDLQTQLARDGREAVAARLVQVGVTEINGVPVAEATDRQIGDFLSQTFKGAKMTQTAAPQRKRYLMAEDGAVNQAIKLMPELADGASPRFKRFHAILKTNPAFKQAGPNWPMVLAKFILGEEAAGKATAAAAPKAPVQTPVVPKIVPPKVTRQAPGAPRASGAAIPQNTELQAARDRVQKGTATIGDVQLIAKHSLTTGDAPAPVRA